VAHFQGMAMKFKLFECDLRDIDGAIHFELIEKKIWRLNGI